MSLTMAPDMRASRPTTTVRRFASVLLAHEADVGRGELNDVDGRKVVALGTADRASDA